MVVFDEIKWFILIILLLIAIGIVFTLIYTATGLSPLDYLNVGKTFLTNQTVSGLV